MKENKAGTKRNGVGIRNAKQRNMDGTIFDDVLRTIQERRGKLLIPVVNDAFGVNHPKDAEVTKEGQRLCWRSVR